MKERVYWVDNVKIFACILVVLGHFFQSLVKASILPDGEVYECFETTIYYFHVPLFLICSGFLYQKYSRVEDAASWALNVVKKALALGVPYFVFSIITWVLKTAFSSSVNTEIESLGSVLFLNPTSPYWYLYCLFFLFVITPTCKTVKSCCIGLAAALLAKGAALAGWWTPVYAVNTVMSNAIWFTGGMALTFFFKEKQLPAKRWIGVILFAVFVLCSVLVYRYSIYFYGIEFLLGLLACAAVVLFCMNDRKTTSFSRYTMPVFLMHTIFAAPVRIVLLRLGVENPAIHVIIGLTCSFAGPIIADIVMRKIGYIDFVMYPGKYIKPGK